jgi:hypothetical protein
MKTRNKNISLLLKSPQKAQAIIEFALVIPLLLLLLYGTIELARLAFIFTSASNASRAAARYAAGSGINEEGTPHYIDCEGIEDVANESAYVTDFTNINITYDRGVTLDGTQIPIEGVDPSPSADSCPIEGIELRNGDRIIVQVVVDYEPIVSIVPLDPIEIVSSSARTFIVSIPILGSAVPTGFAAETGTPSRVPTSIHSNTPTVTSAFTSTLPSSYLTSIARTPVDTLPPTVTFTPSRTPLPSYTPTITPTFISCSGINSADHGPLQFKENYMEMVINNNTGYFLSTSQIYLEWNHDNGHVSNEDRTLHLNKITLNDQEWEGDIIAPSVYIDEFRPTIPTGQSVIRIYFHQKYELRDGTERIIISLATPGCVNYPIDSSR